MKRLLALTYGDELLLYSFPGGHPMSRRRVESFYKRFLESFPTQLLDNIEVIAPVRAVDEEVALFHDENYIEYVKKMSEIGRGYLDYGDTPAFRGCYDASLYVVGTSLKLAKSIIAGEYLRGFNPMGGLHHAMRERASGFCIFNDAGVVIEYVLNVIQGSNVVYVDIDAHHGDGVYYEFEDNPRVIFADIHQDGRTLYPGTGFEHERGKGAAVGTKLNIPLPPGAGDEEFKRAVDRVIEFLREREFYIILIQAGADGLAGDPITALEYSELAHRYAVTELKKLANERCEGRMLAMGGGGYNVDNITRAWMEVVRVMAER
ncbi:MAG: acetoin utilization protein AcuC [Aigarchaeota archaeon]|nr:acetoin utilization protein AcuC [Aigarchaeota archaeon]MDW8093215.1 acetoin utilization protein AcuC [Nitrososphaerota archaeon]